MSDLMEQAFEKLRRLSPERQDELAPMVMMLADEETQSSALTAEDLRIIAESRTEAARGEFATDDEMKALWSKFGV